VSTLYAYFTSFEDILREIETLVVKPADTPMLKQVDPTHMELIYTRMILSFEKIVELTTTCDDNNLEWRYELNMKHIKDCMQHGDVLFKELEKQKSRFQPVVLNNLKERMTTVYDTLNKALDKKVQGQHNLNSFDTAKESSDK